MAEGFTISIDPYVASKIVVASKKLGLDPNNLVNRILNEWVENNKLLTLSTDDIVSEFEKALSGYSSSTKKTKLKVVKTFLEWCDLNKVEPTEEAVDKYLHILTSAYSQSYVSHAKATLKDFLSWYKSTWVR